MGSNPSRFQSPTRPVEQVSWEECQQFCQKLAVQVPGLRLPSEAEWEYACRGGTETATWRGDLEILGEHNAPLLAEIAWYGGNSGEGFELANGYDSSDWPNKQYRHSKAGTRPVATRKPNPWGLYDMLGNVFEWCEDLWRGNYDAKPEGSIRVIRGGSWDSFARYVRAAYRDWDHPSLRRSILGFRLARGQAAALQSGAEPEEVWSTSPSAGAERLPSSGGGDRRPRRGAPPGSGTSRPQGATR